MKKLTRREKFLIYILTCFLILTAGIYLLLIPGYSRYSLVKDQYDEAKYTKTTMEGAIASIPELEVSKTAAIGEIIEKREAFSDALSNEGLDKILTPLCLSYQLSPRRLTVLSNGYAEIATFKPVISSEDGLSEEEMVGVIDELDSLKDFDSGEEEINSEEAPSEEEPTEETPLEEEVSEETLETPLEAGTPILTGVVEMELSGTQINFYRLLDAVANRPDLVITSFEIMPATADNSQTISSGTTTTDITYSNWIEPLKGGQVEIKVIFNLYMVEKQGL